MYSFSRIKYYCKLLRIIKKKIQVIKFFDAFRTILVVMLSTSVANFRHKPYAASCYIFKTINYKQVQFV